MVRRRMAALIVAALWLFNPLTVQAGAPTDTVRTEVDSVLGILRDNGLKGEAGLKVKRERVEEAAGRLFDFVELSKRSLGLYWNRFNPRQRSQFVDLYRKLLEDAYVDRITAYTDEKIDFTREVRLSRNIVEVRSVVATRRGDTPIYYRVINKGGRWKVYDVVVEGVSLVANYRTQFREILANGSPEDLLEILGKKVGNR
jgi:phospholipid transport system substrate-binding protein